LENIDPEHVTDCGCALKKWLHPDMSGEPTTHYLIPALRDPS
jgi:hypothetical protein